MFLQIDDKSVVGDIRHRFSEEFPFLKIEFFKKPHKKGEGSPGDDKISHHKTIGQISKHHSPGALELHSEARVSDVEQAFEKKFGLHVQVFRNMRGTWIQTIGTDNLTLEEQNDKAERSQVVVHPNYNERIEDTEK